MRPALLARTERIGYIEAWDEQRRLAGLVRAGDSPAIIWLLEHDPVYTYGRHGTRDDLFITDDDLAMLGATCLASDRGGQMTWHGPGQVTGYVIMDLRRGPGVRRFVEALVDAMTDACHACGVPGAESDHERMGTYVQGRKLGRGGLDARHRAERRPGPRVVQPHERLRRARGARDVDRGRGRRPAQGAGDGRPRRGAGDEVGPSAIGCRYGVVNLQVVVNAFSPLRCTRHSPTAPA